MSSDPSRRGFLQKIGQLGGAALLWPRPAFLSAADADEKPPRVAAIVTSFTYRSHAHVILENFLGPYLFNGRVTEPGVQVASLYIDQFPDGDMARQVAADYRIPIYGSIAEALCLGGERLAVDAVLSIGEHGSYPTNEKGQVEYPRKRFFDEIAAVCEKSRRGVPVFSDKHLSYRWDWAKEMYDRAKGLGMSLMAGSSVPLAERRPPLEMPAGAKIVEAVSIHGGGVESYDFHGLEVLQSIVEAREGGESGVRRVQFLEGDALWQAADRREWSPELALAAMAAEVGADHELARAMVRRGVSPTGEPVRIHGILLQYRDGLRAIVLKVADSAVRWNIACRLADRAAPVATSFYVGPWNNRNLFKALSHAIQTHFRQKQTPYPVERTLLTTGVLAAAMDSRHAKGQAVDTPQLAIAYRPQDFRAMREMGASWKIVTEATPEPKGMDRAGT